LLISTSIFPVDKNNQARPMILKISVTAHHQAIVSLHDGFTVDTGALHQGLV
jgi:hypothetical protein